MGAGWRRPSDADDRRAHRRGVVDLSDNDPSTTWPIRLAEPSELPALATLWHDAWVEAHARDVPQKLVDLRTWESFADRLAAFGDQLRVAGPARAPLGLCVTVDASVNQLFTSPAARGTGLAADLLADAERRLFAAGHRTATLDVLAQNARAIRFYEKQGWHRRGVEISTLDTSQGPFELPVLVMRKALSAA